MPHPDTVRIVGISSCDFEVLTPHKDMAIHNIDLPSSRRDQVENRMLPQSFPPADRVSSTADARDSHPRRRLLCPDFSSGRLVRGHSRRALLSLVPMLTAALFTQAPMAAAAPSPPRSDPPPRKIIVGALLSLTGEWASLGQASKAALEIAVQRLNEEFKEAGLPTQVQLEVEDTKLDPVLAEQQFLKLTQRNRLSLVVGPQSSAEVEAVKPWADRLGVLVVSQGSTASSLAFADDAIFRFSPTDVKEGEAMAALMAQDGVTTVVPLWRADVGNDGLHHSTKAAFEALGGTVTSGVRYPESQTSFTSDVSAIAEQVRVAKLTPGAKVAVYLASFDEGISILELASHQPDLADVRWFSGDGLTQSEALLANPVAAAFAASVDFTAPTVGLDPDAADIQEPLSALIEARVGFTPDAFALAAYDAAMVGVLARNEVPAQRRFEALKTTFVRAANRYWGSTGATSLDSAGDRRVGNYDFFTVVDDAGALVWTRTGSYVNGQVME
jgi:branched-chain amino acid transport system substrate-binding protein